MEEITLEKIDTIRNRFGLSYEEARDALTANNGNLVETLIYLEKNE
ncbi:MAG TPA: ubiquitin, partial [Clostridiaceae bacterium]|nr:ubiquitin [Clostridiaceae bacterium]